jgi:hypothetical protein
MADLQPKGPKKPRGKKRKAAIDYLGRPTSKEAVGLRDLKA